MSFFSKKCVFKVTFTQSNAYQTKFFISAKFIHTFLKIIFGPKLRIFQFRFNTEQSVKISDKMSRANLAAVSKDHHSDGAFCHRVHLEGHLV